MVTPDAKRKAVAHACEVHGVRQQRACHALTIDRSTVRYTSTRQDDAPLREAIDRTFEPVYPSDDIYFLRHALLQNVEGSVGAHLHVHGGLRVASVLEALGDDADAGARGMMAVAAISSRAEMISAL